MPCRSSVRAELLKQTLFLAGSEADAKSVAFFVVSVH